MYTGSTPPIRFLDRSSRPEDRSSSLVFRLAWCAEGRLRVEGTLAHWEGRLGDAGFIRVHRNALVRLGAVQELQEDGEIKLPSGTLTVSRRRMEELRRSLGI